VYDDKMSLVMPEFVNEEQEVQEAKPVECSESSDEEEIQISFVLAGSQAI
jgi:hypothetical protein